MRKILHLSYVVALTFPLAAGPSLAGPIVVVVSGSPREMGRQQGALLRDAIRLAAADLSRLHPADFDWTTWRQTFTASLSDDERDELAGIAEGSNLPIEKIEQLQVAPRVCLGPAGVLVGSKSVGGEALHFLGAVDARTPMVLVVRKPQRGLKWVSLDHPGSLGARAGVNEMGVSVTLLENTPAKSANGRLGRMFARTILQSAESSSRAADVIRSATVGSGFTAIVADGRLLDARAVEATPTGIALFGINDSAEVGVQPPLPFALRRTARFVDKKLASQQIVTPATQADLRQRQESATRFCSAPTPHDAKSTVQWLHSFTNVKDCGILINPTSLELSVVTQRATISLDVWKLFAAQVGIVTPDASFAIRRPQPTGKIEPKRPTNNPGVPQEFSLDCSPFAFERESLLTINGVRRSKVRFPSPVKTDHPENNTVHGELFRPFGPGPFPCVLVLHIAGGDFELSRFVSQTLSQNGIATLFIKLPYYGERRPPGKRVRMISGDLGLGLGAMRQMALDLRRACDWIESQPELDGRKIGILGISLGAITGGLASALEPRISHACLIMGGAQLQHVLFHSVEREAREYRKAWTKAGGTPETFAKAMAPYDIATYPHLLKQRVVLMISASEDQTIPKPSSLALWEATGRQRIIWYPCGHYTMAKYLLPAMGHAVQFFKDWPSQSK